MTKKRMVTRTIDMTTGEVMTLDIKTAEVAVAYFEVVGKFNSDEELLEKLKTRMETDTLKVVHINSQTCESGLYGMDEERFVQLAVKLPSRNSKE